MFEMTIKIVLRGTSDNTHLFMNQVLNQIIFNIKSCLYLNILGTLMLKDKCL